ncbi:putative FAD-linked oxidoreductase [Neolecta irregularis DAH-3]|uniref:Putative FAD-linked oxidoreductase n=1 Tax=Neolecta irregularis (strain DAH-3) TaxID=1198029 RepID=A0A1U7LJD4_NEOID|nr:putative FAD-linked oxidoreductase [Neolecta irregularis DAH-3]|eukprot:OLL22757.1 putative FAD-linked oxidoreductase [Neolecta irregularis DAH-3]
MILPYLLFIPAALASSPEVVCFQLRLSFPDKISYPGSNVYELEQQQYWSVQSILQRPACIFHPTNAEETSKAISLFVSSGVHFAVKSGGHNANAAFASTAGGILIALSSMNKVKYDGKNAIIGPGGRWGDVVSKLEYNNVTVLSGRIGGLSFLSPQYGLAMDDVLNYEVVLANGTIVNANKYENPELFFGMKGGGNQLGIITEFTMVTHPIGLVYGGFIIYNGSKHPEILSALNSFVSNQDSNAAIITTFSIQKGEELPESTSCFFMYDGTDPGNAFDSFVAIESVVSNMAIMKYSDLLNLNSQITKHEGVNWAVRTAAYRPSKSLFQETYKMWMENSLLVNSLPNVTLSLCYQLLPKSISRGEDSSVMSLPNEDLVWLELVNSWLLEKDRVVVLENLKATENDVERYKSEHNENKGYLPMYVNDAWADQEILSRLSGFQRLKRAKEMYDPNRIWDRTGGFKV